MVFAEEWTAGCAMMMGADAVAFIGNAALVELEISMF